MAVALTSLLLLLFEPQGATASADPEVPATAMGSASAAPPAARSAEQEAAESDDVAAATSAEAKRAFAGLRAAARRSLPKVALVLALLVLAWAVVRAVRFVLRKTLGDWPRATAVSALTTIGVWLFALGVSLSIIAGDVRAFLGSVGLLGLAASWALQTPIESFTGWLLNAFRGYYRVGDRVEVGEVFGDVYRIDVLTTTVWEIGTPFRAGFVRAEQPTGRLITFPNNQILTGSVMNLTRDFEFLWDELSVAVASESDLRYAMAVLQRLASELLEAGMREPALRYERILRRSGLEVPVTAAPEIFATPQESWTELHIRYLVAARQRRKWKSELALRVAEELRRPEHCGKIISVAPRRQLQLIGPDGMAREPRWLNESEDES